MSIKRYDCSPGVDGHMSEDADGEYVRHEDIADVLKDAERYRWLVRSGKYAPAMHGGGWGLRIGAGSKSAKVELDEAIDAVMKGANGPPER